MDPWCRTPQDWMESLDAFNFGPTQKLRWRSNSKCLKGKLFFQYFWRSMLNFQNLFGSESSFSRRGSENCEQTTNPSTSCWLNLRSCKTTSSAKQQGGEKNRQNSQFHLKSRENLRTDFWILRDHCMRSLSSLLCSIHFQLLVSFHRKVSMTSNKPSLTSKKC